LPRRNTEKTLSLFEFLIKPLCTQQLSTMQ
jgi:hypothetical protein